MEKDQRSIVITGVSTGIGYATAKILVENGFHVFGSVRKQADAERLTQEFGPTFIPLLFDVTEEAAVHAAAKQVRQQLNGETLWGLVNNAGVAVTGPLLHVSLKEWQHQLDVNLTGPLIVTQAFAPLLGIDRQLSGHPGRIINVGSVSGKRSVPFLGPYITAKHGMEGFTDTLRLELMLYGIEVILVGPGAVATPIFSKAMNRDTAIPTSDFDSPLQKFKEVAQARWKNALPPERVGEVVLKALTASRPKMRYVVVSNWFKDWLFPSLLPKRIIVTLLSKRFGLRRHSK